MNSPTGKEGPGAFELGSPNIVDERVQLKPFGNKDIKKTIPSDLQEQVKYYKEQISIEKAGKRKLFHSLVKLANELRNAKDRSISLEEQQSYNNRPWYQGGLWRAPTVLPALGLLKENTPVASTPTEDQLNQVQQQRPLQLLATPISLSDLFFSLVVVTAFTRVGVAVSLQNSLQLSHLLYFAIFWSVWSKEASYSTRFDTTDLSASMTTLITSLAVLFASLSAQAPINTTDGTRIMIMAGSVAILHCLLHVRVAMTTWKESEDPSDDVLTAHIRAYAIFQIVMNGLETLIWGVGIFVIPVNWDHRWIIFLLGIIFSMRVPRAFLSNDFHAACSKHGVLFILILGYLLQSIVVVASEFFVYQTPRFEDYAFLGSACLMFFCIKLLYVDDTTNRIEDHALLVNRWASCFFYLGNFSLLLSTTVMGSGLNLLTHSYFAATAALPGSTKNLVCGGFSATLFSILFFKSMHMRRIPVDPNHRALFIVAYAIQAVVMVALVVITAIMCISNNMGGFLGHLMNSDIQLLFSLSGAALVVVILSWLDEGVELALYSGMEDSFEYRIAPFGFWWCLSPEVVSDTATEAAVDQFNGARASMYMSTTRGLSVLSPLMGNSISDIRSAMKGGGGTYDSLTTLDNA